MVSSPDFESGFFYETHTAGINGSEYVESFDFNDYDLSVIRPLRVLEEARMNVPAQVFRSEYLGLYRRAEGSVFGNFQNQILKHEAESPTGMFWGIDFGTGSGGDYSVLVAFNQKHQMCYFWRDNTLSPLDQVKQIGKILKQYESVTRGIYAEQNSIGKIYLDMLRDYAFIKPFNTDVKSKRKIIEQMQVDILKGDVFFINDSNLKLEFSSYESKNNGKTTTYGAPSGIHDDIVMASLIANWCYHRNKHETRISFI